MDYHYHSDNDHACSNGFYRLLGKKTSFIGSGNMNKQASHAKQALTAMVIDGCMVEHNATIVACKV